MLAYIADKAGRTDLAPTTPRERAEVDRWTAWLGAHFGPAIRKVAFERIVKKLVGRGAPDEAVVKTGMEEFAVTASVLEQSLGSKTHLCGRLTVADFDLAPYAALTASCARGTACRRRWPPPAKPREPLRSPRGAVPRDAAAPLLPDAWLVARQRRHG